MLTSRPNLAPAGKLDREATSAEIRRWLDALIKKGRFDLTYNILTPNPAPAGALETPEILVVFRGRDQELLLQHNAELLKALEYVVLRIVRLDPQFYNRIRFDAADYRALRLEELKLSARVAAERVRETKAPFRFNSMTAQERRILHLVLKEEPGIRTASDGAGEDRGVVVYPAESN